jgi:hypothetical protein
MNQSNGDMLTTSPDTHSVHPTDDQLAMSNRHHYYTTEVRNRLSRIRTPTTQDEEKLRLHTRATFHFERDEKGYFDAVEKGDYEGDTIMKEIVEWERKNGCGVNWGVNESRETKNKSAEGDVDLKGEGTDEDPIVID